MHRLFRKEEILTIPNLLSIVRLLLIPLIVWLYVTLERPYLAVGAIVLSGLTDILDGYIARHYDMVSDFGKILDPIADKLTQLALIICLSSRYSTINYLLALFVVKEIIMAISGWMVIRKKDSVHSSQWFGKATTALLYATVVLLFLFPELPAVWANALFVLCGGMILLTMVKYLLYYRSLFNTELPE